MTMIADARLDECREFLRSERGLSPATISTCGCHLGAYLRFLGEVGEAPSAVAAADVATYMARLRARGLRPASVFCAGIAIRSFHRFLVAAGHASIDPTADIRLPNPAGRLSEPLSVDEVARLLSVPSKYSRAGLRDRAIMEVLYCGLRISEALGLDAADVHLDEGCIKVRGKGSKERLVPIGGKAQEAILCCLDARRLRSGLSAAAIFISRRGARLGRGGFWQLFKRYAAKAGIARRVHPHLLRHSFAVHMLAGRADLRSLQLLLGHSSLATTQRYLNLDHKALRETCLRAHPRFVQPIGRSGRDRHCASILAGEPSRQRLCVRGTSPERCPNRFR